MDWQQFEMKLTLLILISVQLALASDSPEPSKKKGGVPDDPAPPLYSSESTPIGIYPSHLPPYPRSGGSDEDSEVDDGESESESESGGSSVNARPAKSGVTATSVEIVVESPAAPPPPEPPLVVIGEPVAPIIAQLQHRDHPIYGHRLFPYHHKSAKQQFCCPGKSGSPYAVSVGSPSKSSISQVQIVSVSAPDVPVAPKSPALPAKIVNEKLVQTILITAPVQPNRVPPSVNHEKLLIGKPIVSSPSTYPIHFPQHPPHPQYPQHPTEATSHQKVVVSIPTHPVHPQPAPVIERNLVSKQIVSVSSDVHPSHPVPPSPSHHSSVVKQVQIVAPPPQPIAYPPASPPVSSKQVQIVSVASSNSQPHPVPPVHEKVPGATQIQNVAVSNQIYPVQQSSPNQLQLVSLSSSFNKHMNIYPQNPAKAAYPPHPNMVLASSAYGPSPSHGSPQGYRILTPSLLPYHPHGHSKYRVADIYSPLVGSLIPAPPSLKPVAPGSPHQPAQVSSVSQIQETNVHYGQQPEPAYPPPQTINQVVKESSQVISIVPGEPSVPAPHPPSPFSAPYPHAPPHVPYPSPYPPSQVPQPSPHPPPQEPQPSPHPPPHVPQPSPYPPPQVPHPSPYPPVHPLPEYPQPVPVPNVHPGVPSPARYPPNVPYGAVGAHSSLNSQNEISVVIQSEYTSPTCAQESGTPYCLADPVYPTAEINAYIAMYPEKYELLRPMVPWKIILQTPAQSLTAPEKPVPAGPSPAPAPPLEQPLLHNSGMCVSHSDPSAKLLRALNEQNKWKCIVQMPEACQISHLEVCDTNRTCRYVDHLVQTQCTQEYITQQLMVYSPEYGIHLDHMKIPYGCKCRISEPHHPRHSTAHLAPEPAAAAAASPASGSSGSASAH